MGVISQDEVRVLDANAEAHSVPTSTLMENAGRGIFETIVKNIDMKDLKGKNVLILCGPGNNGGDGFVAARYLRKLCKVKIYLVKEPKTELAIMNLRKVRSLVIGKANDKRGLKQHIQRSAIVIDALLGVGLKGDPHPPYSSIINMVNKTRAWVISVDIPSGFGSRRAVEPDITVTFHDRKEGMTKEECGKIVVVDIGIPQEAFLFTGPGEPLLIPRPDDSIHKGQRGNVMVVGGGPYYGAPALSALAAQRCGIDLLYMAIPESIVDAVTPHSMNFIITTLEGSHVTCDHLSAIESHFRRCHAMVLGPGIGTNSDDAVRELIEMCPLPMVVDADAIKAIDNEERLLKNKNIVLTPHSNEFRHLTSERPRADVEDRAEQVKYWARRYHSTILLKGQMDIISDGQNVKRNTTGNAAMATGGTGDVLSGIVGAMLAKGLTPFDAARVAAFINGAAGDDARKRHGHSLTASDVVMSIPDVLKATVPWWNK